jgi:hypothetical protein
MLGRAEVFSRADGVLDLVTSSHVPLHVWDIGVCILEIPRFAAKGLDVFYAAPKLVLRRALLHAVTPPWLTGKLQDSGGVRDRRRGKFEEVDPAKVPDVGKL